MSDNEIYLLIKYIKSVLWRVAKRLSYIQDARCLKVNTLCTTIRRERLLSLKWMIKSRRLTIYALNQCPEIVQVTCTPTNRQRCRQASVATYQYVNYSQVAPPRDHAPPREVSWINTRDQSLTQVNLPSKHATLNCFNYSAR